MQLFIEGQEVDVNESFSTLLTASIDDVKNFGSKETTFSKTIILPGTKNNNRIFGNIFNTTTRSPYDPAQPNSGYNFNAAVSAKVLVLNQSIQQLKGTLRLLQINVDGGFIDFEVSVIGELGGFVSKLGAKKLEDLDFSAYNHPWGVNIESSWNNAGGSGYVYPLIDYGNVGLTSANVLGGKHNWTQNAFKPALYAKEYIDKIFANAGYTYDCALFNTARFKNLIVPFNRAKMTFKTKNLVDAQRGIVNAYNVIDDTTIGVKTLTQNQLSIYPLFTTTDNGVFTYQGDTISFNLFFELAFAINVTYGSGKFIKFHIYKNGTPVNTITRTSGTTYTWTQGIDDGYPITLAKNDTVSLRVETNIFLGSGQFIKYNEGYFEVQSAVAQEVEYLGNEMVLLNELIPKNILQKDFITSILKLFNLYVYEDVETEKHLMIKPYVDFFTGQVEDWSAKVDRSKPMAIKPMSELNARYYQFNYKDDSDYYNDFYKKRYNESYGSMKYDSAFEFTNESAKVELIFSPTPLVGYVGEDKIYPTIFKRSGNTPPYTEERVDSNIRLLQFKKVTDVASWSYTNTNNTSTLYTGTVYPYCGHFDDPDNPTNDINFGALKELLFIVAGGALNVNQFNLYYSSYMAEITDKDSKLMSCTIRLTKRDWYNLSFAKFKWIDGSLWRLNKVTDYNASAEDTCKAEFLKLIEKTY